MGVKNFRFESFQPIEPVTVMEHPLVIVKILRYTKYRYILFFILVIHPLCAYLRYEKIYYLDIF